MSSNKRLEKSSGVHSPRIGTSKQSVLANSIGLTPLVEIDNVGHSEPMYGTSSLSYSNFESSEFASLNLIVG